MNDKKQWNERGYITRVRVIHAGRQIEYKYFVKSVVEKDDCMYEVT